MDKLEHYRQCIRNLLNEEATTTEGNPDIECQIIFDVEHDHYQLLDVGWDDLKRIYSCFIHLDIKNDKIWIQRNMTEMDIGQKLVEMGVSKEDIFLGLHPLYKRPYTCYGVA